MYRPSSETLLYVVNTVCGTMISSDGVDLQGVVLRLQHPARSQEEILILRYIILFSHINARRVPCDDLPLSAFYLHKINNTASIYLQSFPH